jgi:hypothetical protein
MAPDMEGATLRLVRATDSTAPLADEPPLSTGAPPGVWLDPWAPDGVVMLRAFDVTGKFAGCYYCPAEAYDPCIGEAIEAALAQLNARKTPQQTG